MSKQIVNRSTWAFISHIRRCRIGRQGLYLIKIVMIMLWLAIASTAQTTLPTASPSPSIRTSPQLSTTDPSGKRRLSLQTATDLLIANNFTVLAARYNIDILRAQRIAASLRPNPSLTVSATQFTLPRNFRHPSFIIKTDSDSAAANTTYTVEVDQLIERGGKRELRAKQAAFSTLAAEAQLRDALRQQLFQLQQAFLTAVLARENLRVAKENLEHFGNTERILFRQVKEGYTAGVDLKRVQLQQLQFQRDVVNAEQSLRQSTRDVLNLIGNGDAPSYASSIQLIGTSTSAASLTLDGDLDILEGYLEVIPIVVWIDDVRKMALDNRPDIKAAGLMLEAAKAGLALAEAQRTRDVTVGGQFSRNGSDNTVGIVMSIPLKIGPRANAGIAQTTATKLQAEAQLRQAQTQALTDVEKAFTAYQISRERLRLFTGRALGIASDVRRIEEIAYRDGAKGLLDFLDAQRAYNQTLVDYNQARFDFLMSLHQLEFATGAPLIK